MQSTGPSSTHALSLMSTQGSAIEYVMSARHRRVVEYLVGGVVAGGERDPWTAVAAGAAEIQPIDRNWQVEESLGAGPVLTHQIRVQQSMAEVARRRSEHGLHVIRRKGDVPDLNVPEVRGELRDLLDDPRCHLVLEPTVLLAVDLDGEGVRERTCGVLAGRRELGVGDRRDLEAQ